MTEIILGRVNKAGGVQLVGEVVSYTAGINTVALIRKDSNTATGIYPNSCRGPYPEVERVVACWQQIPFQVMPVPYLVYGPFKHTVAVFIPYRQQRAVGIHLIAEPHYQHIIFAIAIWGKCSGQVVI